MATKEFEELNLNRRELCLVDLIQSVDFCTTNSILREMKYFQTLKEKEGNIMTIAGKDAIIAGLGQAIITLPMGTQILLEDALLYPDLTSTLLSNRDIRKNGLHVEAHEDNKEAFLLLTKLMGFGKKICEKFSSLQSGLYFTHINPIRVFYL